MLEPGIFTDKSTAPKDEALADVLGKLYKSWCEIRDYALATAVAKEEWNYSKYGWSCRIKGKKAVVIYLMPHNGYFMASLVLGKKASETALTSDISQDVKAAIEAAKVYAEGRGFRIKVTRIALTADIKELIDIKLAGS